MSSPAKRLPKEAVAENVPFAVHFTEPAEDVRFPADKKISPIYGDTTTVEVTNGTVEHVTDES